MEAPVIDAVGLLSFQKISSSDAPKDKIKPAQLRGRASR
jgi:hypothetical protein